MEKVNSNFLKYCFVLAVERWHTVVIISIKLSVYITSFAFDLTLC